MEERVNPFPNDKNLDLTKFKAFSGDKSNFPKIMTLLPDKVENMVGRGENAGYQHFLLFHTLFSKGPVLRLLKVGIVR